jgi:hypothetical protein
MNRLIRRWSSAILVIGLFATLSSGCIATGGGYGYDGDVGIGYYEPAGVVYGGWGGGYRVAPFRGGGPRAGQASRSAPSIPSRSRGGNSRGGESRTR